MKRVKPKSLWSLYRSQRHLSNLHLLVISFSNLKKIVVDPSTVQRLRELQAREKPKWVGIRNDLYALPPGVKEPPNVKVPPDWVSLRRMEEARLKRLSESVWRYNEWEDNHIASKTHPAGFIFGADATEAFQHKSGQATK